MDDKPTKNRFWSPSKSKWLLGLPLGGVILFLLGLMALPAYNGAMHYTSTNEFCYGCHIGMDTVVEEYEASVHYTNRTGVRVTCADCHIPRETIPKIITKIKATADLYHKLMGKITLDNFESHRPALAEGVWQKLVETDSRECRHCHDIARMDPALQSRNTPKRHEAKKTEGKSCIDCHKGVAHKLPEPQAL